MDRVLVMKNNEGLPRGSDHTIKVFLAYANKDETARDELENHLSALKHQGAITIWCKRNITAGSPWAVEIEQHLNASQIIVLLVSPDLLASKEFNEIETQIVQKYETGACVIPVILRPTAWQHTFFGNLQPLPKNSKAISVWENRDQAFWEVAEGLQTTIESLRKPDQANSRFMVDPSTLLLEDPFSPVPPDSRFYIDRYNGRSQIEAHCYRTILRPSSLLRIKAPKLMGKTSLMLRILNYAEEHDCKTVYLNLASDVGQSTLTDLDRLLRWFCDKVTRELGLENHLNQYWDDNLLAVNSRCTEYFEEDVLPRIDGQIVLSIDEVDQLFPFPEIARDFLGMLRRWYENGRSPLKSRKIWQRISLVMAHSTEVYIPLRTEHSPFNVGEPIELPEFTQEQIQHLAKRHGLDWDESQIKDLERMVGGHPFLLRRALYCICDQGMTLEQLLHDAPTNAGIYRDHLLNYLTTLQHDSSLTELVKQVMISDGPVELEPFQNYQLRSMGLIKQQGDQVIPSCDLYRQYFSRWLGRP